MFIILQLQFIVLWGCGPKAIFVDDGAEVLSEAEEERINTLNEALQRDIDIHIRVITLKESPRNIDRRASKLFTEQDIGRSTEGSKGVLFLVDPKGAQVRIEISYGLEHIFTDSFVGYIERRQMVPFFQSGQVGPGIEATTELLVGKALGTVDASVFQGADTGEFLSGGAGARTEVRIGSGAPAKESSSMAGEFTPQPTPMAALEAYRQSLALHIKDPELGIYTPETREFFSKWTVTDAQQDNALTVLEESLPYARESTKGSLAVILFPVRMRQASPYFLVRGEDGWMLDFASMSEHVGFNHKNQWHMRSTDHPYMFAFSDQYFDKHGFPHNR